MGQKDLSFKSHISREENFADLFNGILFQGREIIRADELETADSEIIVRLDNKTMSNVIPDKIRKWRGRNMAVLVVEHQSYVDYRMVLRAMLVEAYGYLKQFADMVEEHNSDILLSGDEFLSKMQKEHRFEPIILIIVYIGAKKEWDAQTCLHDILNIDNELKPYVTNYKLNLFDYHDYDDFTMFKTANRVIFEALANKGSNKAFRKAMENCDIYHMLSRETAEIIQELTDMNIDLEKIRTVNEKGEEVFDLCRAFEEEREIGIEIGKEIGKEETLSTLVNNLMSSMHVSMEKAKELLKIVEMESGKQVIG